MPTHGDDSVQQARLPLVAEELTAMRTADAQAAARAHSDDLGDRLAWRRLTARHGDRLARIMDEHGWPTPELVGAEAAQAAWLVAQHADHQLDVQRRALVLLEAAVAAGTAGEEGPARLAFLRDRTYVNEGREQWYGTQIAGLDEDGGPVPWPCAEPELLDERRAEVGIEPFAAYTARHAPGGP